MDHASSSSYTCAIFAMSASIEELTTSIDTLIIQADNRESAEAEAMNQASNRWPASEGWFGHLVKARAIIIQHRYAAMREARAQEERIM